MGRRRAALVLIALTMIATGCSGDGKKASEGAITDDAAAEESPVGPHTYTVDVDAASAEGQNHQTSLFFPVNLKVRPGDSVVFENRSTQAPHTVTFAAAGAKVADRPSPITKTGLANPLVFEPCYAAEQPPVDAEACPDAVPASPPAYAGTGFWNSGALAPAVAPAEAPRRVSLTVAPGTAPGPYSYVCVLHPDMAGVLEVVEEDADRDFPGEVATRARKQRVTVQAQAATLVEPSLPTDSGPTVAAGWGDRITAINRFSPAVINIKVGQMVTWKAFSPNEPHTVTFESPFKTPEDAGVFTPGGVKASARYQGGFAHSGLIGPAPLPAPTFSLVFTKPGTFSYVCVLHPGMAGQVNVTG